MAAGASSSAALRVLVVTCAHRGDDARIVHRQAASLLAHGHIVTLVSPAPPDTDRDPPGLRRVAIPRAVGRRRWRAWRAARAAVRAHEDQTDLLLVHDPELVVVLAPRRRPMPVVWDVHEDFVASAGDRRWIPGWLLPPIRRSVAGIEHLGRRWCHLLLAEDSYATRFPGAPVVPNSTWVPDVPAPYDPQRPPSVVYVGRISAGRGATELVELGRRLRGRVEVVLIGDADDDVRGDLEAADRGGVVRWLGYLPNPTALGEVRGALAGLSLLHDEPNYCGSRPTKVIEYLAQGVPAVTTPLPLAVELVTASGGGVVVPYGDVGAVVGAVDHWLADPEDRVRAGQQGHAYVLEHFSWQTDAERFVSLLEGWAARR